MFLSKEFVIDFCLGEKKECRRRLEGGKGRREERRERSKEGREGV